MNANDLMLFAGLGVILFIVIMGIIGFCVGAKREFVWITILLLLLGIVWIAFGNVDKLLSTNVTNYASTIDQAVGKSYSYTTLWEFILAFAKDAVSDGEVLFVEGSKAYQALYDIVSCVLRAALLIIGTISIIITVLVFRLVVLVVRIVVGLIKLIVRLFSKKRRPKEPKTAVKQPVIAEEVTVTHDNNNNSSNAIVTVDKQPTTYKKKKKLRWWGAGVGIAKAMLILILIFVPISGVVTIASSVSSESIKAANVIISGEAKGTKKVADADSVIDQVYEYINAYQDSFLGKFMDFSSFFFEDDLSNLIFDDLLTIKMDGEKISLPKEVITYIKVVNYFAPMLENGEYAIYDYAINHPTEMDEAFAILKESKLIPAIVPVGIEYASTMDSVKTQLLDAGFTEEEISDIFGTLVDIDWREDWELLCDILRYGITVTDFFAEKIDILAFNSEPLRKVLSSLGATHFLNEIMPIAIKFALNMEQIKKFIGEDVTVNLDGLNWSNELANFADIYDCFVKLGIGLDDFSKIDLNYIQDLLKDQDKCDAVVELLGYLVGAPAGEVDENINLFAQVVLPIAETVANKQLVDNSLEMFANIISLSGAQYGSDADFNVKKMWQHDLEEIVKIAQLASKINAFSMKVEEINLEDIETLKGIIDGVFSLELLGGSIEYKGTFEELKTALLEAAIEKFEFLNAGSDWSKVNWNAEKENIKGLLDVYGELLELNKTLKEELSLADDVINIKEFSFDWDTLLQDDKGRFIDLVIKAVEVFFAGDQASELFLTAIPNAVNKYLIPKLNEVDSELGELPLFDGLTSDEVREEVLNFIEVFKDVAALKVTTGSPEYSAKVGENKETYALSDALQRIIKSKLLVYTGGDEPQDYRGRIIRIVLKLTTTIDIDVHELDGTLIGGPIDYDGDLNKIDALVTALIEEVVEDDGALNEVLFKDGKFAFDMDKFIEFVLDDDKVNGVIDALEAIFGKYNPDDPSASTEPATLLSALLPGAYYAYLEKAVPEEFYPVLDIYHYNYNSDGIFTGFDLASDISKLLYALHSAIDAGAIQIYNNGKISESTYEITDDTIKALNKILEVLPEINIFQEKFADVIDISLGIANLELSYEAYNQIENKHLDEFVSSLTDPENGVLVKVQGILKETEYIRICDIFALIKSDDIMGSVEEKFMNKTVINLALDAVEQLVNIELVGILLPDLVDQVLLPNMPENINPIIDSLSISSYTAKELIADLVTVIEAARIAINNTEIISYFYDGTFHTGEIEVKNITGLSGVFAKLSELNLLATANNAIVEAINLIGVKGLEISPDSITKENLAHDFKEVLGKENGLLAYVLEALNVLDVETVDDISGITKIEYTRGLGDAGVKALQEVARLEILNSVLPELVEFGADKLSELGYELETLRQMPDQNLDGELVRIANLVKVIYDTDVVNQYFENKTASLTKAQANSIIEAALDLHIYRGLGDIMYKDAIRIAVEKTNLDINVDNINTDDINWKADIELVKASVDPGIELLRTLGYKNHGTIKEFIDAITKDPMSLITRENAIAALNVVDNLVQLDSLSRVIPEGIRFAIDKYLPDYEIGFLADITPQEISNDLVQVAHIARDAVELGGIEFYNNGKFDGDIDLYAGKHYVSEVLGHLMEMNIIEKNSAEILAFALNFAAEKLEIDEKFSASEFEGYSIKEEIELAKQAGKIVIELLKENNLTTVQAIKNYDFSSFRDLITDTNVRYIAQVVELLPNSKTIYHVLPVGARYAATTMDILKPLEGNNPDELHEDLIAITEVINIIAEHGVEDIVNTTLNSVFNYKVDTITLAQNVLEKVLFLNVVKGSETDFLREGLKLIKFDDASIDYYAINWESDKQALVDTLGDVRKGLDAANITDVEGLKAAVNSNDVVKTFAKNEILENVYNALSKVANLTILEQFVLPVYDKYVLPSLDKSLEDLADINTIYQGNAKPLIEDLKSIVNVIGYAIELDACGIYNGNTIDYQSSAIGNIITSVFGINYLNIDGQLEKVVNYVLDLIKLEIEIKDINTIDMASDGEALARIYNENFAPYLSDEGFVYKTINDFKKAVDIKTLANGLNKNDYATSIVKGLQQIVDLSFGQVAIYTGVNYAVTNIAGVKDNKLVKALELDTFTKEELVSDIVDVLKVALIAVDDFNALSLVNGFNGYELPEGAQEKVHEMGSLVFNLNILAEPTSGIIEAALTTYLPALDVTSVNFENVTLANIEENIKELIVLGFKLLDDTGITGYNSAMNYYEKYIKSLSVVYETVAVNDAFAIIDTVLDNAAVRELLYAVYKSYATEYVGKYGIDGNSYANNSSSMLEAKQFLLDDVLTIVDTLKMAYNFISGDVITYSDVDAYNTIIDNLFELHILNDNLTGLVKYINETIGLNIDATVIDLASDKEELKAFYLDILPVLTSEDWLVKSYQDVLDIINTKTINETKFNALLTNENAEKVLDSVHHLANTTLVGAALGGAEDKINEFVPADYEDVAAAIGLTDYLAYNKTTKSLAVEDIHSLIDAAKEIVKFGVLDYYSNHNLTLIDGTTTNAIYLQNAIEYVFKLNALKNSEALIESICKALKIKIPSTSESEYDYFAKVKFADEAEIFSQVVGNIYGIMRALFGDNVTVSTVYYFVVNKEYMVGDKINQNLITKDLIREIVKLGETLVESNLVMDAAIPAYNNFLLGIIGAHILDLAKIDGYNPDLLKQDIHSLIDLAYELRKENLVEYFKEFINQDHSITINYETPAIARTVETVLKLNLVEIKEFDLVRIVVELVTRNQVKLSYTNEEIAEMLDLRSDASAVGTLITELQKAIFEGDFYRYASDYRNVKVEDFTNRVSKDEVASKVVEAMKGISETTIVNVLYRVGVNYGASYGGKVVDREIEGLIETKGLSKEEVKADYEALLSVVEKVISGYGLTNVMNHVKNTGDIKIYEGMEVVEEALSKVAKLNVLKDKIGRLIEIVMNKYVGTSLNGELEGIDYESEMRIINEVIEIAKEALKATAGESLTYNGLARWVNGANYINEVIYEKALEGVEKALELKTLAKVVLPVYGKYESEITKGLGEYSYLGRLDYTSGEELVEDIRPIVVALKDLGAINPVGMYLDYARGTKETAIAYGDARISKVIEVLLASKYVESHETDLIETLVDVLEANSTNVTYTTEEIAGMLDLRSDASVLAENINQLAEVLLKDVALYASEFNSFDSEKLYTNDNVVAAIDSLEANNFTSTTISEVAYRLGIEILRDEIVSRVLGQRFEKYFVTKDKETILYTNAEVKSDLDALLDLVKEVAAKELVIINKDNFDYRDLIIADMADLASKALTTIPTLNLMKDKLGDFVAEYLSAAEVTDDADLTDVDLKAEFATIGKALKDTSAKLAEKNIVIVNDVLKAEYTALIPAAVTALDGIIDLTLLDKLAMPVVEYLRTTYIEDLDSFVGQMTDVKFYNEITSATLMGEIRTIVKKVIELYNNKLADYLDGFTYDTELDYVLLAEVASDLYEVVAGTEYVANKERYLVQTMLDALSISEVVVSTDEVADRLDLKADTTVIRNTLTYLAQNILSDSSFLYNTINEWKALNISDILILLTSDGMVQHSLNTVKELVGTTEASTIAEVAYVFGVNYGKEILNDKYSKYTYVIDVSNNTNAEIKADLDVIISVLQAIIDNNLYSNVEAMIRNEFDVCNLNVEQLYPVAEIILTNVLGTETHENLNALSDNVSPLVAELIKDYAKVETSLADVNMKHETSIILEAVKQAIELGVRNNLLTINDYLGIKNRGYSYYATDENAYEILDIINGLLELDTIAKHGTELYDELVYNKFLAEAEIAKYLDLMATYESNTELVNDLKVVVSVLRDLTNPTELTTGLVAYAKDVYYNNETSVLTSEFIAKLSPAIVTLMKVKLAGTDANIAVEELLTKLELELTNKTIDLASDADKLETLVTTIIDIVIGDMTYASELRSLTVNRLLDIVLDEHNISDLADAIDAASETSVMRLAYNAGLTYADILIDENVDSKFANMLVTELPNEQATEDIHSIVTIIKELDSAYIANDINAMRHNYIDVLDINLVKYQPVVRTILNEVVTLNAIASMSDLVVATVEYVNLVTVDSEMSTTLASIDYTAEANVISNAVDTFVPNMAIALGDAERLTTRQLIDYVKSYKTFDDNYDMLEKAALVSVDTLETLNDSMLVKTLALPTYNKYLAENTQIIPTIRYIAALDSSYTSDNFKADYMKLLSIVRSMINAKLYKVAYNRHLTQFEVVDNFATELQNIVMTTSTLDFLTINNNAKFIELIDLLATNVNMFAMLKTVEDEFANVNLENEARLVADKADDIVTAFKSMQKYGKKFDLPMFGDTELVGSVLNMIDAYLASETHKIITPVLFNDLLTARIYSITETLGRPQEVFADDLTNEEVYDLFADAKSVLDLLFEAGVFANGTISLTNATGNATNEKLVTAYEIMMNYIVVSERIERALNNIVTKAYMVEKVEIDYSVMSIDTEKPIIKNLILDLKDLATDAINMIKSRELNDLVSNTMEERVNSIYNDAMKSEIAKQLALPMANMVFAGALNKYAFVLFDEADGVTIDNVMDEVTVMFEAGRKIASAFDFSGEKIGFVFANFAQVSDAIDELIAMKSINGGTSDNLEEAFRYAVMKVLKVELSDQVVALDEVEVIKVVLNNANPLIETGAYADGKIKSAILSKEALDIITTILDTVETSTMLYEVKDKLVDKVQRFIPESVRTLVTEMVKENTVDDLKSDTAILSDALELVAQANIYNGGISITTGTQFDYIADAYELIFTMKAINSKIEEIYENVFKRIDLTSLDENIDPVANVKAAIANEGWSWANETAAIADAIRALGALADSGVKVMNGYKPDFDAIMDATDEVALTRVLKAINNTSSMRTVFISIIKDLDMTIGSLTINEFYSEWLNNQLADGAQMASKAEWDVEIESLVRIYIDSKNINTEFATMTDSDIDELNSLLKQINASKLFDINALVETSIVKDALSNMVSEGTEIKLADTSTWTEDMWNTEIDNLCVLLKNAVKVGATSSSFDISTLSETEVVELLTNLNNSNLVRTTLPIVIMDTLTERDLDDLASDWLKEEYRNVTDDDQATVMSSISEWNNEIPNLAKIVVRSEKIEFANEENRSDLEIALYAINHSRLFNIEAITNRLTDNASGDSVVDKLGFTGSTLGTVVYTTVPGDALQTENNKMAAWDNEIAALLSLLDLARELNILDGTASVESVMLELTTYAELKNVLDTMNNSELFRVLLPRTITTTADSLGTTDYISEWLQNEKTTMSSKEVWVVENGKLAKIIETINNSDIDFESFNNGTVVNDTKLNTIKKILLAIDDSQSFVVSPIVKVINDTLNNVQGIAGANIVLDENNVTDWNKEFDILFGEFDETGTVVKRGIYSMANELDEITMDTLALPENPVGTMLDKMVESELIYPVINQIFEASISSTDLYKSSESDTLKISDNVFNDTPLVNARIKDELTSIPAEQASERWSWSKEIAYMVEIKNAIDAYNRITSPAITDIVAVATTINTVIDKSKVSDGNGGYKPTIILTVAQDLANQVQAIIAESGF